MRKKDEKYIQAVTRIEELTSQLKENPDDHGLLQELFKAEDALCKLIKDNESEVEALLKLDSEPDEDNDYFNHYDITEI